MSANTFPVAFGSKVSTGSLYRSDGLGFVGEGSIEIRGGNVVISGDRRWHRGRIILVGVGSWFLIYFMLHLLMVGWLPLFGSVVAAGVFTRALCKTRARSELSVSDLSTVERKGAQVTADVDLGREGSKSAIWRFPSDSVALNFVQALQTQKVIQTPTVVATQSFSTQPTVATSTLIGAPSISSQPPTTIFAARGTAAPPSVEVLESREHPTAGIPQRSAASPLYVRKDGAAVGPYLKDELLKMLRGGELDPEDLAAYEGSQGWSPIYELLGIPKPPAAPLIGVRRAE